MAVAIPIGLAMQLRDRLQDQALERMGVIEGLAGAPAVQLLPALVVLAALEEVVFRGFLLPRMRGVFGRRDWVANGVLFTVYHLHVPWVIPTTLVEGIFLEAYPSRRFQSAWLGIIVHSLQSVFVIGVVLALVLK